MRIHYLCVCKYSDFTFNGTFSLPYSLQGLVFARKTSLHALWSTPLTSLCPKGNQPLSTVRQRDVQPPQWNGTKMGSELRRTATTPAPIACCCPAGPSSSYASSTDDGASPTMAATCAWPETTWARRSVTMHPWK